MQKLNRNVWLLAVASALGLSTAPLVVFVGGLIGSELAPDKAMATLPVAAIVVGTAMAVIPIARLMQSYGRSTVFRVNILMMICAALGAAQAIEQTSFWGFCFFVMLLGVGLAAIQQYRFAAMESVDESQHAPAASFVLLGGLVAAFVGPELGQVGRELFDQHYSGSFVLLAVILALSLPVLFVFKAPKPVDSQQRSSSEERTIFEISSQPVFWVAVLSAAIAYAVMSYVMTATPVTMHNLMGHSLEDTKWVIQIHIMSMYIPSFFSGFLIQRFGQLKMLWLGLACYAITIAIAWSDPQLVHFYVSLILLGVGWNLLFVSGTSLLPQVYKGNEAYKVQGINDFSVFGLQAMASLSSGAIVYAFGWTTLLFSAIPVLCIQLALLVFWKRSA
ncbi:hypothetical protein A3715_12975 [Oleiphilus sp. HI0009]|uniref:MFS transporter n=3 Tax=unclassified Oleiphilus TaxID=2631174 RepID=UPI0007C205B1|nr:MFS transporter [Oleiphilus sp. HI0066]KZX76409.1 hypothetical protein A3715_12975 [Oleiphilus sp. HI0009]KZY66877.1 hypothetical protein A3738_05570 [Oleiphilus sp. HI0066]MCH2158941.1 MFS transporter [Oleiphilaceae bacterium]